MLGDRFHEPFAIPPPSQCSSQSPAGPQSRAFDSAGCHGRASKPSRGMDRWDDGDNCGYCVTGGRGEGCGRLLAKPTKTPRGRVAEWHSSRPIPHVSCLFEPPLLERVSSFPFDNATAGTVVTMKPHYVDSFVLRRHVWLVFRICRVVSLMHKVNSLSSPSQLPPTICRAAMVDMGRSKQAPSGFPSPSADSPRWRSPVSQSLPPFLPSMSR